MTLNIFFIPDLRVTSVQILILYKLWWQKWIQLFWLESWFLWYVKHKDIYIKFLAIKQAAVFWCKCCKFFGILTLVNNSETSHPSIRGVSGSLITTFYILGFTLCMLQGYYSNFLKIVNVRMQNFLVCCKYSATTQKKAILITYILTELWIQSW